MGGVQALTSIFAGIGCRRDTGAADIIAVLRDAEARAGIGATALAAPAFKSGEAGLLGAASTLGLSLVLLDDDQLASVQPSCPTRSVVAARCTGHASIAEASAMAAAGLGGRLVLARIAHATATCALAVTADFVP